MVFHGMTEASDSCSGNKKCLIWDGSKHWRARSSKADVPERGLGHSEAVKYRILGMIIHSTKLLPGFVSFLWVHV